MKRNIAVIGTGHWGSKVARNFYDLGVLHTACDVDESAAASLAIPHGVVRATTNFEEVIANPEIDALAICTPAASHAELARRALVAGKDVFVEKPLCLDQGEGQELNRLAVANGRILMVGHLLWYHPKVLKLKEIIDRGELGAIRYIYANRLNLGRLRREENVLWSFAPHDVSVILGLTGQMPAWVHARARGGLNPEIADTTVSILDFANGISAHIFVSWLHPFKEQTLVVVGEKKMAVFDDTAQWDHKLLLYPYSIDWDKDAPLAEKAEAFPVEARAEEPLRAECAHFVDCINNRTTPRTDGREALRVLKVLNACQTSIERNSSVGIAQQEPITRRWFAHETAIVDQGVEIGQKTRIWHFSHIRKGSKIGAGCSIGQNVVIGPDVTIGKGCKIQNNVSIFEGVVLEDKVFCGPGMMFTNVYNPRCEIPRKDRFRRTVVKKGATIGANATIVCGITIGRYAFIGAGTVVTRDVKDFALIVGNPGRQVGWMSRYGRKMDLPLEGDGQYVCPHTGDRYMLSDGKVALVTEGPACF